MVHSFGNSLVISDTGVISRHGAKDICFPHMAAFYQNIKNYYYFENIKQFLPQLPSPLQRLVTDYLISDLFADEEENKIIADIIKSLPPEKIASFSVSMDAIKTQGFFKSSIRSKELINHSVSKGCVVM